MLFGLIQQGFTFTENLLLVLAFVISLIFAIIPHEIAHGYAALKQGDPSAKIAGRLSLNPVRHIDPIGLAAFVFIGIGWAKPVPVNPFNYKNFRRGNFIVSSAGIVVNFCIGFLSSLFFFLVWHFGNGNNLAIFALTYLFYFSTALNVSLMIFNLIPIPPLDGFNMLVSVTKPNNAYMQFMRRNSHTVIFAFMIGLMILDFMGYQTIGYLGGRIVNLFVDFWDLII